ncbi:nucleotide sugar dehydrogenase [Actinomadura sp. HBU206391]|uniref:nucleotide sugar dehydrogenase n=1 Tax=Actinomadura sp. HBU206391 TaxID=2731692 RepID=UPI0016509E29|nr:nucleotide sugar dehydrogenase [Actinomadura sp. HBU206391]MBC6456845.1 nucleotide sugar dehydrogenase [Actinomadura sp. HBU206391]
MARRLVVIGQGYVGLPLALRAVDSGFHVVGLDSDEQRIKQLSGGDSYVDDISSEQLAAALGSGRYVPTCQDADATGFDICVITVPTPLRDGIPDLSHVQDAARTIARYLRPGCLVVLESTTYPGTTEELLLPLLEEHSGLRAPGEFLLGYSPERIDPGNPCWNLQNTPKIVAGLDNASLAAVQDFYARIVDKPITVSTLKVAELIKLIENTFRHVNIALINEIAIFADQLGIDIWEATEAASTKPFGYLPFYPGPGVGGHCLPVDPSYLSWQVKRTLGHNFRFVELANDINDHMPDHVVRRVTEGLNARLKPVNGSRVLLLGLAYKKNTGDLRESPALAVVEALRKLGADLRAADPHVEPMRVPPGIALVPMEEKELRAADAVVVLTDHDAFDFELVQRESSYVFDTRNRCSGPVVERL